MKFMVGLATTLLLAASAKAAADAATTKPELKTIAALHLPRYLGTWYEIAKFPNKFQRQCAGFTTANYSVNEDGTLRVVNRCRKTDGSVEQAVGAARQIGESTSPKLQVRFAPAWLSFLPQVWANYWVIDLDPAYQLAAVSEPKRQYLWVLSRSPVVDPKAYAALLERLADAGFDVSKLERTRQAE
jgi:apolipoprotein D and lipocalin family protein